MDRKSYLSKRSAALGAFTAKRKTFPSQYGKVMRQAAFVQKRYFPSRSSTIRATGYTQPGNAELKSVDTIANGYNLSTVANFTCLNQLIQGTALWQRDGQNIKMKSLYITGDITPTGNFNAENTYARIMVVYDRQTNKLPPGGGGGVIGDVLLDTNSAAAGDSTSRAKINLANRKRYVILMDKHLNLPAIAATVGAINYPFDPTQKLTFKEYIRLNDLETDFFNTNGGTFADISTGGLWLVCFSDDTAQTPIDAPTVACYYFNASIRLRYCD